MTKTSSSWMTWKGLLAKLETARPKVSDTAAIETARTATSSGDPSFGKPITYTAKTIVAAVYSRATRPNPSR